MQPYDESEIRGRYFPLSAGWSAAEVKDVKRDIIIFASPNSAPAAKPTATVEGDRRVQPNAIRGLLDRFASLDSDESIVAFARDFGALELCKHGLPHVHQPHWSYWTARNLRARGCDPVWLESLKTWRSWIQMFGAMLRIVETLRRSQPTWPRVEDWNLAGIPTPIGQPAIPTSVMTRSRRHAERIAKHAGREFEPRVADIKAGVLRELEQLSAADRQAFIANQRRLVAERISMLIDIGGVRPVATWDATRTAAILTGWVYGSGLFGTLAVQLAIVATAASDTFECGSCHRSFTPSRMPPSGRKRYFCSECKQSGAARRMIDREAYARKKSPAPTGL